MVGFVMASPRVARFTPAEQAALDVVPAEIAVMGRSEVCHGAIAGRADVSVSTVERAMAEARRIGLVLVEERRISRFRNDTNVVTILYAELRAWVATRGRGLRAARGVLGQGNAVHAGTITETISLPATVSATTWEKARRWAWRTSGALPGHRAPSVGRGSTPGRPGVSWSRSDSRRRLKPLSTENTAQGRLWANPAAFDAESARARRAAIPPPASSVTNMLYRP